MYTNNSSITCGKISIFCVKHFAHKMHLKKKCKSNEVPVQTSHTNRTENSILSSNPVLGKLQCVCCFNVNHPLVLILTNSLFYSVIQYRSIIRSLVNTLPSVVQLKKVLYYTLKLLF